LAFTTDGKYIATANSDPTVYLLECPEQPKAEE
jgi:hypothetical protein